MDQKLIDSTRAIPRQTKIDAEAEIHELSLDELDHVAGGFKNCCQGVHYSEVKLAL